MARARYGPFSEVNGDRNRPSEKDLNRVVLNVVCRTCPGRVTIGIVAELGRAEDSHPSERTSVGWPSVTFSIACCPE